MIEKDIDSVKPFGRYGVGVITEHPAGLLVIAAVILLTVETIPGARSSLPRSLLEPLSDSSSGYSTAREILLPLAALCSPRSL